MIDCCCFFWQFLVGQYAQSGLLCIWKAFPLAQGFGIVWVVSRCIFLCEDVIHSSRILFFLFEVQDDFQMYPEKRVDLLIVTE